MKPVLSPNTQAILLLTAPLIAGRGASTPDLLSPGEYKKLARHLRELQRQPADLVSSESADLLRACHPAINEDRLKRLLARGFLLSQVMERWHARAIWVVSRADADYPRRLKSRLREDAPPVLYGCGDIGILETGGLAVVGSRHVDDSLVDYTQAIGRLVANAGRTVVSGGAKGIDQAAMRGALEAGGRVSGVVADSLESTAMNREHRNLLLDGQLVLISPYDPNAGFNVGNAMQRNKLIYALADASLVVSSDLNKGGTWSGAAEQLDKLRFVPVYVRSTGARSDGLTALRTKGAIPWPNPGDAGALEAVFRAKPPSAPSEQQSDLSLFDLEAAAVSPSKQGYQIGSSTIARPTSEPNTSGVQASQEVAAVSPAALALLSNEAPIAQKESTISATPAEVVFAAVREAVRSLSTSPLKDAEVAEVLDVSTAQAKAWLRRLVDEGVLEKQKKPSGYVVKQKRLFE